LSGGNSQNDGDYPLNPAATHRHAARAPMNAKPRTLTAAKAAKAAAAASNAVIAQLKSTAISLTSVLPVHGYNDEHGYWWGRDEDTDFRISRYWIEA
jgi:hypothetical protein